MWIAPENSSSFSVSVVLPASGCEMMAKVRRRATSCAIGSGSWDADSSPPRTKVAAAKGMEEPKHSKAAPPAVEEAAKAEMRQEAGTSALTPDSPTAKWPFPPSSDYLPDEPHDSVEVEGLLLESLGCGSSCSSRSSPPSQRSQPNPPPWCPAGSCACTSAPRSRPPRQPSAMIAACWCARSAANGSRYVGVPLSAKPAPPFTVEVDYADGRRKWSRCRGQQAVRGAALTVPPDQADLPPAGRALRRGARAPREGAAHLHRARPRRPGTAAAGSRPPLRLFGLRRVINGAAPPHGGIDIAAPTARRSSPRSAAACSTPASTCSSAAPSSSTTARDCSRCTRTSAP